MRKKCHNLHIRSSWIARLATVAVLATTLLSPVDTHAKSYNEVLGNYQQADFKNCVKNSRIAMKPEISSFEKAKILKIMGICQFMIKNKSNAAIAFRNALKFNPNTEISQDEVLDPEVIRFFKEKKAAFLAAKKEKMLVASSGKFSTFGENPKKTTLQINSNTSGKVTIEGIYAGVTGQPIDADGGQIKVTVSANGFRTRTVKINVIENKENLATVNLTKPKPKPKKKPTMPPAVVTDKRSPKGSASKVGDGLFADENSRPELPERDLAREFEMETGSGGYQYLQQPAQAPIYQSSPFYQPPVFAPPPAYVPPNATPPVIEAPPPNYQDESSGSYRSPTRRKNPNHGRRVQGSQNNILLTLAPFGAGQFQNGDLTMGAIIGGGQVAGLVFWYMKHSEGDEYTAKAQAELARIGNGKHERCPGDPAKDSKALEDCQNAFLAVANPIRKEIYSQANYGLWAFGGLWVAGIIEAITNEPKDSRSMERPRLVLKNKNRDKTENTEELAWTQYRKTNPYWNTDLNFDPQTLKPIYGLGFRFEY